MSIFKKKKVETPVEEKREECPSISLDKAQEISKQYDQLSKCCQVLSEIRPEPQGIYFSSSMYTGGWRLREYSLSSAGIDVEEVYKYIGCLAEKRRKELECELAKLEAGG